jgi:phytoene/squalene synthetase
MPIANTSRTVAVYSGIHDPIRRNNYDVLDRRAVTTTAQKVLLVANA